MRIPAGKNLFSAAAAFLFKKDDCGKLRMFVQFCGCTVYVRGEEVWLNTPPYNKSPTRACSGRDHVSGADVAYETVFKRTVKRCKSLCRPVHGSLIATTPILADGCRGSGEGGDHPTMHKKYLCRAAGKPLVATYQKPPWRKLQRGFQQA